MNVKSTSEEQSLNLKTVMAAGENLRMTGRDALSSQMRVRGGVHMSSHDKVMMVMTTSIKRKMKRTPDVIETETVSGVRMKVRVADMTRILMAREMSAMKSLEVVETIAE
jgi:hypothetical protein